MNVGDVVEIASGKYAGKAATINFRTKDHVRLDTFPDNITLPHSEIRPFSLSREKILLCLNALRSALDEHIDDKGIKSFDKFLGIAYQFSGSDKSKLNKKELERVALLSTREIFRLLDGKK